MTVAGSSPRGGRTVKTSHSSRRAFRAAMALIPRSGQVEGLVDALAKVRGRPITLLAYELPPDAPSGLWIQMGGADYVVHATDLSTDYKAAVICHELAHMLLDHQGPGVEIDTSIVAPSIDPTVAARFFARHGYDDAAEVEAETLGTLLSAELAARAEAGRAAAVQTQDAVSIRLR